MISIEQLRILNKPSNIIITEHARIRLLERNISMKDIVHCIKFGEIIEHYPNDKPLESCLILGFSVKKEYIHIVVSCDKNLIYLITAYFPNSDVWENNLKTRRKVL